ncbi:MAG: efflux RND transporter periplasmic adaptor subunit [Anaerovoracaceae bacterium]
MKKGNKKKWILIGGLLIALIAVYGLTVYTGGVEADTTEVEKGPIRKLIKETGTVESDNTVIVASNFSGEIKSVIVSEGDTVNEGELLLTGDESVAQLDLKSLRAQLSGLEASHARAKETVANNKILYEQGALSRQEYDAAITAERELAAQISSLRYSIESFAKAAGVSGVTAPIRGTITEVYAKEGEFTTVGAGLFEITDLDSLYIKVNLIAEDADLVKEGNEVLVYSEGPGGLPAAGSSVRRVHLKAKEALSGLGILQKRVAVEVRMDPTLNLRLGSDVDVEIVVEEKENVLRVPDSAVFKMDGNRYAFVAEKGKARLRQVETGLEGDGYVEILSGLSEGETVILSPNNNIEEGTKLK